MILDRKAADKALRLVIASADYDLHKALERDEETGEDTYGEHVDRFIAEYAAALPYLAPAGDGGLREALEQKLATTDGWAVANETLLAMLAAHPAAPAVPQPVDREALAKALRAELQLQGVDEFYDVPGLTRSLTDVSLAVLAGEQEQVEP